MANTDLSIPSRAEADLLVEAEQETRVARDDQKRSEIEAVPALSEWTLMNEGRQILIRRVAPPVPVTKSALVDRPATAALDGATTAMAFDEVDPREPRTLSLTAVVHQPGLSEIIWVDAQGQGWPVLSNVDFSYLGGIGGFTDESHAWMTFVFVDETGTTLAGVGGTGGGDGAGLSGAEGFAPSRFFATAQPEYVVLAEAGVATPSALHEELDALHAYYAENELRLIAAHERTKILNEAREAWHQAHPPEPRDVVLNFWRVR